MNVIVRRAVVFMAALFACVASGCAQKPAEHDGKILVVASIPPLADFAGNVGGKHVRVETLVPPGSSSHTFQISVDQMKSLNNADVLVLNGLNLEMWAQRAVDAAENPKLVVVDTSQGIPTIGSSDPHDVGANPHVWLDPVLAVRQVEAIRDALIKADPKHKRDYEANARRYIAKLRQLDDDIRRQASTFTSKEFIAFHAAWGYFAQRYGLVEAGVIEANPGREPSIKELSDLVRKARKLKARAIFAEPQFSPKAAEVIAEETGTKVLFLDPQGSNYIATMRSNLREMSKALK